MQHKDGRWTEEKNTVNYHAGAQQQCKTFYTIDDRGQVESAHRPSAETTEMMVGFLGSGKLE